MENNDASEVTVSGTKEAECSETTVEIKIKTLDSQTYTLRVNKCMPVPALKEEIANVTGVLSEQQRLICRGKVLKDDQLLSAYHVEDGHTLHLVVRQPLQSSSSSATSFTATNPAPTSLRNHSGQVAHSLVFGTVNVADQGDPVTSDLSRIFSTFFGSFGINNGGMGSERVDARGSERHERTPGDIGDSDPTQPHPNQTSGRIEFDPQNGVFPYTSGVSLGHQHPAVIPDSLTTLFQYLSHIRHEFNANAGRVPNSNPEGGAMHGGDHNAHLLSAARQGGLPTPEVLAEVMLSARQLLMDQAAGCLSDLARQLAEQASLTDPLARTSIQSSAMRSGSLFQNLGSLLLELGRTITTLRMGQTPSVAVVNAGPAIFISAAGPSPIMVQAGTSFGGIPMGTVHTAHGLTGGTLGPGFLSRNVDIRIRRGGHSVPVTAANLGEQGHTQQPTGRTDASRNSGESMGNQAFQGVSGNASIAGESGIRVVPIRTVVAVPAGVSRPPSDSSSGGVGLLYPLLARYQQQNPGNSTNTRSSHASGEQQSHGSEIGQQPFPYSAVQRQNIESNNGAAIRNDNISSRNFATLPSEISPPTNESAQYQQGTSWLNNNSTQTRDGQQSGQDSMAQMFGSVGQLLGTIFPGEQIRISDISLQRAATDSADQTGTHTDAEAHEEPGASDDGVFFSGLVRQLMPLISQGTATEPASVSPTNPGSSNAQIGRQNSTDLRSPQHCHDAPTAPDSKRQKRE